MIPHLPPGTVGFLATVDRDGPAVIPVSALHRVADDLLLFALAPHRGSLARLRDDPRTALSLTSAAGSATVYGRSRVVADPLPGADFVVALALRATRVADTLGPRTTVLEGVRWDWRDDDSRHRHGRVMAALARIAGADGWAGDAGAD